MFVCLLVATVAAWFLKFDSASMGLLCGSLRDQLLIISNSRAQKRLRNHQALLQLLPTSQKELDFLRENFGLK